MRTRNALERLACAAPAVEVPIDAAEEERVLEQILASPRAPRAGHRRVGLLLAGAAAAVAAAIVSLALTGGRTPRTVGGADHRHGGTVALAGYKFRLPAGYDASADTCQFWMPPGQQPGTPVPVLNSFAAAASAEGGCIEALLISGGSPVPADASSVPVGSYDGFVASRGSQESLYVEIPAAEGDHYLVLLAQGLTTEQLISIAESGLPSGTALPAQTCTEGCG